MTLLDEVTHDEAEGKLFEQEFDIKCRIEENDSLKQTVESISRASVGKIDVYNNGSMSASSSVHSDASFYVIVPIKMHIMINSSFSYIITCNYCKLFVFRQ